MKNKLFVLLAAIMVASLVLGCAKPAPAPAPAPSAPSTPSAPSPEKPSAPPSAEKPSAEKPAAPAAPDPRDKIIEAAKKEGKLVVVGGHADLFSTELRGFAKKYPFIELDASLGRTSAVIKRVTEEVQSATVTMDVDELPEDAGILFERKKLLQKPQMAYPHLKDFEARLQPASGAFVLISLASRPQGGYNTDLVSAGDLPSSWEGMTDPKWKGKVIMSLSGGGDPGRMAWLWRKGGALDWDRSFDFFTKLGEQEPEFQRGYTSGAEKVAAGDDGKSMFWMVSPSRFSEMKIQGEPVDLLAFKPVPARFSSVGILKGAPNPNAAWLFIDYLTSPEGQVEFTDFIAPELPLNPKAQPGILGGIVRDAGAGVENTEAAASDFNLDAMASAIFTDEALKKSADFYEQLMAG